MIKIFLTPQLMELPTFAYSIGIIEIIIGLPLVFYPKSGRKWLDKFLKEDLMMRVVGTIIAVLGALVLLENYQIGTDPAGVVRLVAWLIFFKGLMWAWWPQTALQIKKKWFKTEAVMTFGGLMATAIGILLVYAGSIL